MVWVMGEYLCGEKTSLEERVKVMNGSRPWGWGRGGRAAREGGDFTALVCLLNILRVRMVPFQKKF